MGIFVDTCVLPRCRLEEAALYRNRFGPSLGFELLAMFDLPDFEANLTKNLDLFAAGPLTFHEPVWGVEHAAPRGSPLWEAGMYHIRLTRKFADILRPSRMVYHLSNSPVLPFKKDRMLRNTLENMEELQDLFPGVTLLVENTGIREEGTQLLDQAEFTDLCRDRRFPVLIDVGHANANGWNLEKLIPDLKHLICGFHLHNNDGVRDQHNRLRDGTLDFEKLIPLILRTVPQADLVIEYTRPLYHGDPLTEDIAYLQYLMDRAASPAGPETDRPEE